MADAAAATIDKDKVRLQVAALRQEESGRGIARMPRSALLALGLAEGDAVEIEGKRVTAAIAFQAYAEDETLEVVRLDGLLRANADTSSGEHVRISRWAGANTTRVAGRDSARRMRTCSPEEVSALARSRPSRRTTSSVSSSV